MRWRWTIEGDPTREVLLQHNYWSGSRKLFLDGSLVATGSGLRPRWSHELAALGPSARVVSRMRWLLVPEASLEIDDHPVAPVVAPRDIPWWAWVFVVANLAILVHSRGGALPGAIAAVGAVACLAVVRSQASALFRGGACVGVTALVWAGWLGLVWLLAR